MPSNSQPSKPTRIRPAFWAAGLGLFALFAFLRWNNFSAPLIRDEGEYACCAQLLQHGGMPYRDVFMQKPPMIIYSYWLADRLVPQLFAPRLLAALAVALATGLLGFIARREFGAGVAWLAMGLMSIMVFLPGIYQFTANTEMFLLAPLLGICALYSHGRTSGHAGWHWLGAGFLAVTALLYKSTALPVLLFIFIVWSVELWRKTPDHRPMLRAYVRLLVGALIAAALELGYFALRGGWPALWDCTVTFNRHYVASDNFSWLYVAAKLKLFWTAWWILFLLTAAAFWKSSRRTWF